MKLWTGQTISEFGTAISQLAIPFVALKVLHATTFEIASLGTVQFLPFLLFTLPAGVWVDRWSRRVVLIVGDLGRGLLGASIPIAYALGSLTLSQLYVVGFLTGILTVFFDVAYQAYLPSLVEREHLVEGNSKLQITVSGANLVGPGLAGLLIKLVTAPYAILVAWLGESSCFWLDTASFLFSGGFLVAIRKPERLERSADAPPRSLRTELWEGLRYVLGHRLLRPQAIATGTSNFFSNLVFAIFIVYAVRRLGMSAAAVGLVFSLGSIGWLLGSMSADRIRRRLGVGLTTTLGMACTGPSLLLIPLAPKSFPSPVLIAGVAIGAWGAVVYNITQVSLRQTITPQRMQGRMNAVMRFLVWGTIPLGSLTGGALGTALGLRTALFIGAAGGFTAILPIILSPIRSLHEFPEPEEPPSAIEAADAGVLPTAAASGAGATAAES